MSRAYLSLSVCFSSLVLLVSTCRMSCSMLGAVSAIALHSVISFCAARISLLILATASYTSLSPVTAVPGQRPPVPAFYTAAMYRASSSSMPVMPLRVQNTCGAERLGVRQRIIQLLSLLLCTFRMVRCLVSFAIRSPRPSDMPQAAPAWRYRAPAGTRTVFYTAQSASPLV